MKPLVALGTIALLFSTCMPPQSKDSIVIQGHRGCRGILPENSTEAFIKAIDLGVTTLEMDIVITGDHQVLISHEPFFNGEICTHPNGEEISEEEGKALSVYLMNYDSIQEYPCGHIPHPRFPEQNEKKYYKPLLKNSLDDVLSYCTEKNVSIPELNIELKNRPEWYNKIQPAPEAFVDLVLAELEEISWPSKISLQSFDIKTLQVLETMESPYQLILLNEKDRDLDLILRKLGFVPPVYSPSFELVDESLINRCEELGMNLSVWTVNEDKDLREMVELGVRDIISDYPGRAIKIVEEMGMVVK